MEITDDDIISAADPRLVAMFDGLPIDKCRDAVMAYQSLVFADQGFSSAVVERLAELEAGIPAVSEMIVRVHAALRRRERMRSSEDDIMGFDKSGDTHIAAAVNSDEEE